MDGPGRLGAWSPSGTVPVRRQVRLIRARGKWARRRDGLARGDRVVR